MQSLMEVTHEILRVTYANHKVQDQLTSDTASCSQGLQWQYQLYTWGLQQQPKVSVCLWLTWVQSHQWPSDRSTSFCATEQLETYRQQKNKFCVQITLRKFEIRTQFWYIHNRCFTLLSLKRDPLIHFLLHPVKAIWVLIWDEYEMESLEILQDTNYYVLECNN